MTSAIEALADDVLFGMLSESPDIAQSLGIVQIGGRTLAADTLPDFSEAGVDRRALLVKDWSARLRSLPVPAIGTAVDITHGALDYVLNIGFQNRFAGTAGARYLSHIDPVTHMSGVHAVAVEMLAHHHPPQDRVAAERYVARLARLPVALAQATENLRTQRQRKHFAPAVVLKRAVSDIEDSLKPSDREQSFIKPLIAGFGKTDPDAASTFIDAARAMLRDEIRPAYGLLLEELGQHVAADRTSIGSAARAGGDEFYAWRFRGHTTTSISPEAAHVIALEELERLHETLRQEFANRGYSGTVADGLKRWAQEDVPEVTDDARREVLERLQEVTRTTRGLMRPLFNLWPTADVVVNALPQEHERSQHSYYIPPPAGGSKPGIFWLNCRQMSEQPCSEATMVCYHEAWPGHHLQLTLAQELELPAFRRAVLFNAYLEGWAKYAEGLPESVGIERSPHDRIARLRTELYSTATLALDTGIHTRGWSQEEARTFFMRETAAEPGLADMVVMRSIGNPAQLAAYKVGLLKVRELRAAFEQARASAFRLPDFHDAFLGQGALPLDLLERSIRAKSTMPS